MKRANRRKQEHRLFAEWAWDCYFGIVVVFKRSPLIARVVRLSRSPKDALAHAHRPDAFSKSFRVGESPLTAASAVPVRLAAKCRACLGAVAALGRVHSPGLGVQGLTDVSGNDFRRV